MELEVFKKVNEKDYDQLAVVDQFKSLVVNRRFYEANDFELNVALNRNTLEWFKVGNSVRIGDTFYYINLSQVSDLTSGELLVKGVSFFGLLNNRIIWENYNRQARPEVIMRDLLDRHAVNPTDTNRKLYQVTLAPEVDLGTSIVRVQTSYTNLRERVEKLAETHEIGFKEGITDYFVPGSHIEFYKGRDLSSVVEFTTDAENVLNESFEQSDFDERNIALVSGEGEGDARQRTTIGDVSLGGLDRRELHVDARDLQKETDTKTYTNAEYEEMLVERGRSKLSEHQPILLLEGDINVQNQLYEYGVDYDLGDTVRRSSPTFGLSYNAQITEIQEIYEDGLHIIPTFGKRSPTIIDLLKRT